MAKDFIFQRRVNGVIETFYPKTNTKNVVKTINDSEVSLDAVLDGKGAFVPYSESNAETSGENDLLFEILGNVIDSDGEIVRTIKGTIVGDTPPEDTEYLWIDNSTDNIVIKCYKNETETWELVNIASKIEHTHEQGDIIELIQTLSEKAPIDNPNFTTAVSMGRKEDTTIGEHSVALGINTTASGEASHAEGYDTTASGLHSHAEGVNTTASGDYGSHAEGLSTNKATEYVNSSSTNEEIISAWNTNKFSLAKGEGSHVSGGNCLALGEYSHAEGGITIASGGYAHSEGQLSKSEGGYSHAEGYNTTASGEVSHAEGHSTVASAQNSHAEGYLTQASGDNSHAEGLSTLASGDNSHAEGLSTTASGIYSHVEGLSTNEATEYVNSSSTNDEIISAWTTLLNSGTMPFSLAKGSTSHVEGWNCLALGDRSHAEGTLNIAIGNESHVEGLRTKAQGHYSHSEGQSTTASGEQSHAEGYNTTASGNYSHTEGVDTTASGGASHAEGNNTAARGNNSHAEGAGTTASENCSHAEGHLSKATNLNAHAEGYNTTASGTESHAEGHITTASGNFGAHAEGNTTTASGEISHAEGWQTIASGNYSHAEGVGTIALQCQHAQGHFNNTTNAPANNVQGTSTGTAFVIGNGVDTNNRSNAFRVTGEGLTIGLKAYQTGGADFSEFREWVDGNPNNEDRVGYFVTMQGKKIKKASPGDYIRGVISGNPCVIGNGDECWKQRYVLDDFGRFIYEEIESTEIYIDEEGVEQERPITIRKMKEHSDYDPSQEYIPRSERKEWDCVGMVGQLAVRDDGTCQIDGFCKVADGGIATYADWSEGSYQNPVYRVVNRISENIVEIEM